MIACLLLLSCTQGYTIHPDSLVQTPRRGLTFLESPTMKLVTTIIFSLGTLFYIIMKMIPLTFLSSPAAENFISIKSWF